MPSAAVTVEMKLAGVDGAWTDVSADVLSDLSCTYGISGGGPTDRVASTGSLTFQLDNSASNSAHRVLQSRPRECSIGIRPGRDCAAQPDLFRHDVLQVPRLD
jgi:hypothetical protein